MFILVGYDGEQRMERDEKFIWNKEMDWNPQSTESSNRPTKLSPGTLVG